MTYEEILLWLLLGAIQGVTEWLPISSKTQVMLFGMKELGFSPKEAFSVGLFLQGGTTLAAIYAFRREVVQLIRAIPRLFSDRDDRWVSLLRALIIMALSTGIFGLPLLLIVGNVISSMSSRNTVIFTGLVLLFTASTRAAHLKSSQNRGNLSMLDSAIAGIVQSLSVIPGISRSGIVLAFFGLRGFDSEESFRLVFLSGIPATLASSLVEILLGREILELSGANILLSLAFSLIVGILSIRILMSASRRANMVMLSAIFGALALIWAFLMP
ncbi:MAG: undecaprenyl-diphosphate phosphatase [Thermoproteota archaeon]